MRIQRLFLGSSFTVEPRFFERYELKIRQNGVSTRYFFCHFCVAWEVREISFGNIESSFQDFNLCSFKFELNKLKMFVEFTESTPDNSVET